MQSYPILQVPINVTEEIPENERVLPHTRNCPGEFRHQVLPQHTLYTFGETVQVLGVPAWFCDECGLCLYSPRVSHVIYEAIKDARARLGITTKSD